MTEHVDRPTAINATEESDGWRALPPLSAADGWPEKPGVKIRLNLVHPAPERRNGMEEKYAAGLAALEKDDALAALEQFRAVVAQDATAAYSTVRLLTLLLSAEVGDLTSLRVLLDSCLTNAQPDAFAQRAIETAELAFYCRTDSKDADIIVRECLDQPATTAQVALAACFLALGERAGAVDALVDGATAWEARKRAWKIQVGRIADEVESGKSLLSDPAMRKLLEGALIEDWPESICRGLTKSEDADALRAAVYAVLQRDRGLPRAPAGALVGFDDTVCWLYAELNDFDAVIGYVKRYPRWQGSEIHRANALVSKGLPDAALVVLDDYLRDPDSQVWANFARYRKATILIGQGDRQRARRELARLYADDPSYEDSQGLRTKLDARGRRSGRSAIPEQVRHAVWRRDEGRCVQCGSQEKLEYDHIIPIVRGGANTERNLQLLCEPCNRAKSATV